MPNSAWDGLLNNQWITELPHYAINKKAPEDAYFTKRNVAEYCMGQFESVCKKHDIKLNQYRFIEPSVGEGCFFDIIPFDNKVGIDININIDNPEKSKLIEADYLKWYPEDLEQKYVVIGNPPFGHRGAMALAFVNRSMLFADLVAFILPMSFYSNGKGVNMKRVENASLIHSETLDRNSFYDPETKNSVPVNTVFQIWRKGEHEPVFVDYDISEFAELYTCCSHPNRYCGLGRGRQYDCFIASTFYGDKIKIVNTFDEVQYGSGIGIIIKKQKKRVLERLLATDWTKFSSNATNSCKHIRMFHIRKVLGEAGFGIRK